MWTQTRTLPLLLLVLGYCLHPTVAQSSSNRRQSIWEDPIKFSTKSKDACTMVITGQGENTKLRLACQSTRQSYWCEYVGKPHLCRSYNNNPRHYFVQMMWDLRKLHNACQAPRQIKPHMCKKAVNESQMVFSSASPGIWAEASRNGLRPSSPQPARPQPRPATTRPDSTWQAPTKSFAYPPRVKPVQRTSPQPTALPVESNPKRLARLYCWRSLERVCAYIIGLFRN
ncbi:fibroblast growth factor binding protein 2a [Aulostomus maculatus]